MTKNRPKTEIQAGTRVRAQVSGAEDLWVSGRIDGRVDLEGTLVVEASGVVNAEVRAHRVVVAGLIIGDVYATDEIEVTSAGQVQGNLRAAMIRIDEGARIAGTIEVGRDQTPWASMSRPPSESAIEPSRSAVWGRSSGPNRAADGASAEGPRRTPVVVKKRN